MEPHVWATLTAIGATVVQDSTALSVKSKSLQILLNLKQLGFISRSTDTDRKDVNECASLPCANGVCIDQIQTSAYHHLANMVAFAWTMSGSLYAFVLRDTREPAAKQRRTSVPPIHAGTTDYVQTFFCNSTVPVLRVLPDDSVKMGQEVKGKFYIIKSTLKYETIVVTTIISACSSAPCRNGGLCNNVPGGYICTCNPGYTGQTCGIVIDECTSQPCLHGAICQNHINGFECVCATGYEGTISAHGFDPSILMNFTVALVLTETDECTPDPCQNGGTCVDLVAAFRCRCVSGYTGTFCETAPIFGASLHTQHRTMVDNEL
ncbi:FBP1-like protein [Mya arenaria]|uniref:FBP1-like protein n=1 Tax=Mya arenaria TaxID=6604 RepID=A0ABY7D9I8_MYAAR|nr:FBP1-like protein [Mya arenaria]